MPAEWKRKRSADTGIPLEVCIGRAIDERPSAGVEIRIESSPHARPQVVADMNLPAANRILRSNSASKVRVLPKNPETGVEIHIPASEPPRNSDFGFDSPAIGPDID